MCKGKLPVALFITTRLEIIQVSIKGQLSTPQNNFILEYYTTIKNTGKDINVLIQKRYLEIKGRKKHSVPKYAYNAILSVLCVLFLRSDM